MDSHFDMSDSEFENAFENCKVPPALFNHEAHLRLAWIHISKYGLEVAEENIQQQLNRFVAFVGASDKYNKTLTIVAIRAVGHFFRKSTSHNFSDFLQEFPQLKAEFKPLIESHYSFDIFNSVIRKRY